MAAHPPIDTGFAPALVHLLAARPGRSTAPACREQAGTLHHWWCLLQGRLEPVAAPELRTERQVAALSTFILHVGLVLALMLVSLIRTQLDVSLPEERIAVRFSQAGQGDGGQGDPVPSPAPHRQAAAAAAGEAGATTSASSSTPSVSMPDLSPPMVGVSSLQGEVAVVRQRDTPLAEMPPEMAVAVPVEGPYVEITDPEIARALARVPPPLPSPPMEVAVDPPVRVVEREVAMPHERPKAVAVLPSAIVSPPLALPSNAPTIIEREVALPVTAPRMVALPVAVSPPPKRLPGAEAPAAVVEREVAIAFPVPAVRALPVLSAPAPAPALPRSDIGVIERTIAPPTDARLQADGTGQTPAVEGQSVPLPVVAGNAPAHSTDQNVIQPGQGGDKPDRDVAAAGPGQDWSRGQDAWSARPAAGGDRLFDADGRPRLAQADSPSRGAPGGESDSWTRERLSQAGTWLKRPPYEHRPTSFDRYWVPHESLLAEWVRKGIQRIAIPVPGTGTTLQCVISVLQFGGGCGLSDPGAQEHAAQARAAPDIPFKRALQEDNGSL